jgi:hypothetical protein
MELCSDQEEVLHHQPQDPELLELHLALAGPTDLIEHHSPLLSHHQHQVEVERGLDHAALNQRNQRSVDCHFHYLEGPHPHQQGDPLKSSVQELHTE